MFNKVNSIFLFVDDLEHGAHFYESFKGLHVLWKNETMLGMGIEEDVTELVLVNKPLKTNVAFEVSDVLETIDLLTMMGGEVIQPPYAVKDGKEALIKDPFGNIYIIKDLSADDYLVDEFGNIVGEKKKDLINKISKFILD